MSTITIPDTFRLVQPEDVARAQREARASFERLLELRGQGTLRVSDEAKARWWPLAAGGGHDA